MQLIGNEQVIANAAVCVQHGRGHVNVGNVLVAAGDFAAAQGQGQPIIARLADFDAAKVYFAYRPNSSSVSGWEPYWHLMVTRADGTGLRQLTDGPDDEVEPCYLPDGGIVYVSSKAHRYTPCNAHAVGNLWRCDGDGGSVASSGYNKDFVINDDLIVDGSACIGQDCVNGESFGFDTIRVKENNLRIKFDDTSVVPSFPANDWQLTANDSANGGASKFSIDDISGNRTPFTVEANARSHALYVDDGGRIGSRTSTPSVEIHTIDGLRADYEDGWGLVRPSNTTPILVVRFDAESEQALERIKAEFRRQMLGLRPDLNLPF